MHRAEQILQAVAATLTGLPTTGANVQRARVYEAATLPALTIGMGADEVVEGSDANLAFVDRLLTVQVTALVKSAGVLDTTLNQIRSEVWQAMMADRSQGLAFVLDTLPQGAQAPEIEPLEQGVARQVSEFVIHYRHSITNPEA